MAKTRNIRQRLAEAKKLGMTPIQYSRYLKTGKKPNKVIEKAVPDLVYKNLTKSEKGLSPERLAELQKIRARNKGRSITSKTIRDVGTTKDGTAAERRAVAHGKKIAAETGSKDKGNKAAIKMIRESRKIASKEVGSLAADAALIAMGGPLAAFLGRKVLSSAAGKQLLGTTVGKAATAGVKKLSGYFDKAGRAISSVAFAALPATAKLALRNADKAAAAAKAARVSQKAIDPSKAAASQRAERAAANKVRTDAAQKANRATGGNRPTVGGSSSRLKPGSRKRFGGSGSSTPQSKVGTAAVAAALAAANMRSGKKKPPPKKPIVVKPTSRKTTPLDLTYRDDEGSPIGTVDRKSKPKKRNTLFEAMFGGFETGDWEAKDQMLKDGTMLTYDFPEDLENMKKGGSIKKKMKKGKVTKRAALRGQGKALRGF